MPDDDDPVDVLLAAWQRVREKLRHRPAEVIKRLRRGRELWKKRPPRAWCLVIRASDTRITPVTARCEPADAAYPHDAIAPELRTTYAPHRVTIDKDLLIKLTERVRVDAYGESQRTLAQRLGRGELGLNTARAKGRLKTHHELPTGGRGGNPRPVISVPERDTIDPNSHLFQSADRAWGWTGRLAYWRLPDEFAPQVIERVPFFIDRTRPYARDTDDLHPEHPLRDPPPLKPSPYKLGKPVYIDNAQYKWKGDQFVGYDWRAARTNPRIRQGYERHQHRLERIRNWRKRRAAEGKASSSKQSAGGSLQFRGWMWLCPTCGRRSKVLYYPLPPVNVICGYATFIHDDVINAAFAADPSLLTPPRASGLACHKCHGVHGITRAQNCAWNEIVTRLSGGLLYGHEVPSPPGSPPTASAPTARN